MGGSSGGSGPTKQQQDLETQQGIQQANLDQTENDRRKRLLQATAGLRVFRGSALTTAPGANVAATGAPSAAQQSPLFNGFGGSLLSGGPNGGGAARAAGNSVR